MPLNPNRGATFRTEGHLGGIARIGGRDEARTDRARALMACTHFQPIIARPLISSTSSRPLARRVSHLLLLAGLLVCAGLAVAACGGGSGGTSSAPRQVGGSPPTAAALGSARPNVVFVLTDDMSTDLVRFMPHVLAMERHGLTFTNYFVSDSLCCPSRASIFTGDFPHDTHVWGNFGSTGGFQAFHRRHEERHTFAVALQRAGYRTAMMGKYLNGYLQVAGHLADGAVTDVPAGYVPLGWNQWDVAGWGYGEFNYTLNEKGVLRRFGHRRSDYLTDVLAQKGVAFIDAAARRRRPFFLELATFAPHSPYVPAPEDKHDFPGLESATTSQFRRPAHPLAPVARLAPAPHPANAWPGSMGRFAAEPSRCRPSTE